MRPPTPPRPRLGERYRFVSSAPWLGGYPWTEHADNTHFGQIARVLRYCVQSDDQIDVAYPERCCWIVFGDGYITVAGDRELIPITNPTE